MITHTQLEDLGESSRLFPTTKVQEDRSTSILFSVMELVPSFAKLLLKEVGHNLHKNDRVETRVQIPVSLSEITTVTADGLIAVVSPSGAIRYSALVETKTWGHGLDVAQIERTIQAAETLWVDNVITLSNLITEVKGVHPLHRHLTRETEVNIHHWSWMRVLSNAVLDYEHHGVEDPEQRAIMGELIRYFSHRNTGIDRSLTLSKYWNEFLERIQYNEIDTSSEKNLDVCRNLDRAFNKMCMLFSMDTGRSCVEKVKVDGKYTNDQDLLKTVSKTQTIRVQFKIAEVLAPVDILIDLKSLIAHINIKVQRLDKLWNYLGDHRMDTDDAISEMESRMSLGEHTHMKKNPKSVEIYRSCKLGRIGRSSTKNSFIDSLYESFLGFYNDIAVHTPEDWSYVDDLSAELATDAPR